jgi:hypothetical protein
MAHVREEHFADLPGYIRKRLAGSESAEEDGEAADEDAGAGAGGSRVSLGRSAPLATEYSTAAFLECVRGTSSTQPSSCVVGHAQVWAAAGERVSSELHHALAIRKCVPFRSRRFSSPEEEITLDRGLFDDDDDDDMHMDTDDNLYANDSRDSKNLDADLRDTTDLRRIGNGSFSLGTSGLTYENTCRLLRYEAHGLNAHIYRKSF